MYWSNCGWRKFDLWLPGMIIVPPSPAGALVAAGVDREEPAVPADGGEAFVDEQAFDVERYPRTAAAAAELAGYISTEQYLWGLRRVLDGITTSAA